MPSVFDLVERCQAELARFDPDLLSGADCAAAAERLAALERTCLAARVRAAARAAACGVHRDRGFRDASEWLARVTGSSTGQARSELATAEALGACTTAADAFVSGDLSLAQAREIAGTEAQAPGSERDLVELARTSSLRRLQDEGRTRRERAVLAEELHARQRRARRFRHWRDELGMIAFAGALPPEVGVPFVNRLEAEAARIRRIARRGGSDEPWEAHAADGFAEIVSGAGTGRATQADLVIVADLNAWRRGHTHDGEPCHIIGGGPIPVDVAKDLARDAFLKAVIHDGDTICTVAHFGRHIPARLRTALELGAPPGFHGAVCVGEGCDNRYGLEWDHDDPVAHGGLTSYDNVKPRCRTDHRDKTRRDREAGLLAPPDSPDPP